MQRARRYPGAGWPIAVTTVILAVVTVAVRTRGVPVEIAVSYGAQALTGPLFAAVGATVLARHRGHRMGRFCLSLGAVSTSSSVRSSRRGRSRATTSWTRSPPS